MKTVKYVLVMLMTAGLGIFASCSDNENSCTPLSITRISTVTDREQGLEVANLAQYIIVQGTGLDGVKSILVNDVPVDMSNAYTTANEITFPIPRVIPVEVNNLITLSTATESTTAPLSVFIPDLRVDGMYNEFTPAGGTMKIVGDFFDLYEITTESGQLFFGDQEMDIIRAVQDTLYFNLPEDAIAGTKIKIVSPIAGERLVPGRYYERGDMLCDYDPYTGWGGNNYVNNGPVPEPITGNYSRFKIAKEDAADWEWSGTVAIAQIGVNYWDDVKANQDNYQLKFEVNTLTALSKRQIRFFFEQINYDWEPFASGLAFKTNGEWQTISIDLNEVWKGDVPNTGTLQVMGNSFAEDTDICFDNFRIVPKN